MRPFCSGENCQLKLTCYHYAEYLKRKHEGKSIANSYIPHFNNGTCPNYYQKKFYGD